MSIQLEPINRVAARVVAPSKNQWHPINGGVDQKRLQARVMMALNANRGKPPPSNVKNRIGIKSGRMTVVCFGWRTANRKMLWIARCQCGKYEARSNTAIANWGPNAMCQDCDVVDKMQNRGCRSGNFFPKKFSHLRSAYPEIPDCAYKCKCGHWYSALDHFWPFIQSMNICLNCIKNPPKKNRV